MSVTDNPLEKTRKNESKDPPPGSLREPTSPTRGEVEERVGLRLPLLGVLAAFSPPPLWGRSARVASRVGVFSDSSPSNYFRAPPVTYISDEAPFGLGPGQCKTENILRAVRNETFE